MNKKGEERIFTLWWFVAILAVSAVIVLSVLGFYSKDIDTKKVEAEILYERLAECVVANGYVASDFRKDFDVYKKCSLSEEVFSEGGILFFSISIDGLKILEEGDKSLESDCSVKKNVEAMRFPGCVNRSEDVLIIKDKKVAQAVLNIVAISNQVSENYVVGGKDE
jgi:hypothetical protein